jgi:hypothetical protein
MTGTVYPPNVEKRHGHLSAGGFRDSRQALRYVLDKDHVAHRREIVVQDELNDIYVINRGIGEALRPSATHRIGS